MVKLNIIYFQYDKMIFEKKTRSIYILSHIFFYLFYSELTMGILGVETRKVDPPKNIGF